MCRKFTCEPTFNVGAIQREVSSLKRDSFSRSPPFPSSAGVSSPAVSCHEYGKKVLNLNQQLAFKGAGCTWATVMVAVLTGRAKVDQTRPPFPRSQLCPPWTKGNVLCSFYLFFFFFFFLRQPFLLNPIFPELSINPTGRRPRVSQSKVEGAWRLPAALAVSRLVRLYTSSLL